ncbi:MAG: DUF3822 family protein [Chitinophagaceae bacterium]|nr:MAG: DUF3822 family protein [Chitinophagaceae bacterium]
MKILFNHIAPEVAQSASNLLIEAGNYGVSCIWYNANPNKAVGVRMYHFQEHSSGKEIAGYLMKMLSEPEFSGKEIFLCVNVKEAMIVPSAYFSHSSLPTMLELMYGKNSGAIYTDTVEMEQSGERHICYNSYRVNEEIMESVKSYIQPGKMKHSTSLQVQNAERDTRVYGIVYHHKIKLLLFKEGALQLVQQYPYKTPADAAYILLNACHQHAMLPAEVEVKLAGIIDKDSNLFREIARYFMQVSLQEIHEEVEVDEGLKDISAHYFSHLTHLLVCV